MINNSAYNNDDDEFDASENTQQVAQPPKVTPSRKLHLHLTF